MNEYRLVHDGKKVIAIVEGTEKDSTKSSHTIEIFDTEEKLNKRIDELGLGNRYENDI